MSNITTGRQLRAARILAGLTQKQLAQAVGVHERAARYWELKEDKAPTSTPSSLIKIEAVLRDHGVIVFATPTAGVRLATYFAAQRVIIRDQNWQGDCMKTSFPSNGSVGFAKRFRLFGDQKWSDRWRATRAAARTLSRVVDPSICCVGTSSTISDRRGCFHGHGPRMASRWPRSTSKPNDIL